MRRSFSGVVLTALVLAACASTPKGFLIPTPVTAANQDQPPALPAGTRRIDMLVVTTRHASSEPGVVFGGERDSGESVSEIVVSVPPSRKVGALPWPRRFPPDPQSEFTTVAISPSEHTETIAWFDRVAGSHARLLIFVHGFNTRFESAVYRFAQITADSGADAAPVLFSWPSRGQLFDYEYDRDSAIYSRDALERTINRAVESDRVKEIVVLAHSMGAYLAMEALRQTGIRHGSISPKIRSVILASPDIDTAVFQRQYAALGPNPPHFTIFVARDDRALLISRFLAGNLRRLGSIDPSSEPVRSRLEASGKITVIDLTALKGGDRTNHGKFAESPEVVQLIGAQLVNGQVLTDAH
jgi:esterase/lipase superfamily enzyme